MDELRRGREQRAQGSELRRASGAAERKEQGEEVASPFMVGARRGDQVRASRVSFHGVLERERKKVIEMDC